MTTNATHSPSIESRAQGALYGQIIGDNLGALVEFRSPEEIARIYPGGVRELADGGVWGLIRGQATDDSEMALALARSLLRQRRYDAGDVLESYRRWLNSPAFDVGTTIGGALRTGQSNPDSQANGALMRVSPLAIFHARNPEAVRADARADAQLTHVHPLCADRNESFAFAVASGIGKRLGAAEVVELLGTYREPGADLTESMGWVEVAYGNAAWELEHTGSFVDALSNTIGRGGDTDTNAAICGALFGAVYGVEGIPQEMREAVDDCRPSADSGSAHPRPEEYWPCDAAQLALKLLG